MRAVSRHGWVAVASTLCVDFVSFPHFHHRPECLSDARIRRPQDLTHRQTALVLDIGIGIVVVVSLEEERAPLALASDRASLGKFSSSPPLAPLFSS
jgi:hypothetical protein